MDIESPEVLAGSPRKKKKSGIPTGNAGEYFVMGELLRRGFDAQLADRNTRGYDILMGKPGAKELRKIQVKTVRSQPWYINIRDFTPDAIAEVTIYVLLGGEDAKGAVRYFITRNHELKQHITHPAAWKDHGFMSMKAVSNYENKWELLKDL